MREKPPRVYCTRPEYQAIQDLRALAVKRCQDLDFQRDRRNKVIPFPWTVTNHIGPRRRDGSLPIRVTIVSKDGSRKYQAKQVCELGIRSTSGRYIELRGELGTNTIQRNGAGVFHRNDVKRPGQRVKIRR